MVFVSRVSGYAATGQGSMDVNVEEGSVQDLAQSTNVPPVNLGALAVGTQNEWEDEEETSVENQDGKLVAVHPLASTRHPTVVIHLLGKPFLPSVGLWGRQVGHRCRIWVFLYRSNKGTRCWK